jgi:hypothetical protein
MVQNLSSHITFRSNNMSKDNPFSRFWKKKADHLWSQAVKQAGRCAYCGSMVNLQAHHLIPRTNSLTRHKIECGLCLCEHHHLYCSTISPHLVPEEFEKWLRKSLPHKYRWMRRQKSLRTPCKIDYEKAFLKLSGYKSSYA